VTTDKALQQASRGSSSLCEEESSVSINLKSVMLAEKFSAKMRQMESLWARLTMSKIRLHKLILRHPVIGCITLIVIGTGWLLHEWGGIRLNLEITPIASSVATAPTATKIDKDRKVP
jgi:hypothetical protein